MPPLEEQKLLDAKKSLENSLSSHLKTPVELHYDLTEPKRLKRLANLDEIIKGRLKTIKLFLTQNNRANNIDATEKIQQQHQYFLLFEQVVTKLYTIIPKYDAKTNINKHHELLVPPNTHKQKYRHSDISSL